MSRVIFRPLAAWTDRTTVTRTSGSKFKTEWAKTLRMLREEADWLHADLAIVQVVTASPDDLRQDGMLRARAQVLHPGAVVTLETSRGPLRFATDRHESRYYNDPPEWQMNVHAIVLGLGALRAVDRYGITTAAEQYTGFLQIGSGPVTQPAPGAIALPAGMTTPEAVAALAELAGLSSAIDPADETVVKLAYRKAARTLHPDTPGGGDRAKWDRLNDAMRALGVNGEPS